jgi:hypothetical protein
MKIKFLKMSYQNEYQYNIEHVGYIIYIILIYLKCIHIFFKKKLRIHFDTNQCKYLALVSIKV